MRGRCLALLMLTVVLQGCLGGADQGGDASSAVTGPPGEGRVYPVEDTFEACDVAVIGFLHEIDEARAILPPGWEPGDAQAIFGTPVPTGRALAGIFLGDCANLGLAGGSVRAVDLFVLVESPSIVGADPGPAFRDFYLLVEYTDAEDLLAFLGETGFDGSAAEITLDMSFVDGMAAMEGTVSDAEGEVLALGTALAPVPLSDQSTGSRFWQEVPGGLAFFEISFPETPFGAGALTTCRARPGSPASTMLGAGDCTGDESFVLTTPGLGYPYAFHFLPGAHLEP